MLERIIRKDGYYNGFFSRGINVFNSTTFTREKNITRGKKQTDNTVVPILEYFSYEEGRVRYIPADSTMPAAYVYDYFIKDHLGNIRMVLTEQTKEDTYAAMMEPQNATVENQLFDNISSTTVLKPTGFDSNTITSRYRS